VREGLCANYLPYPNLQAFRARSDAAGTNAGTINGTDEKRKPPPHSEKTDAASAHERALPRRPCDAGHAAGMTAVARRAAIVMNG
jgi:hypothetical protein